MASRFYPQKDIDTFDKFNKELVGDLYTGKDGIIYQPVVIYKISATDTEVTKVAKIKIINLSLLTFNPKDLAESSESESILILLE